MTLRLNLRIILVILIKLSIRCIPPALILGLAVALFRSRAICSSAGRSFLRLDFPFLVVVVVVAAHFTQVQFFHSHYTLCPTSVPFPHPLALAPPPQSPLLYIAHTPRQPTRENNEMK